MLSSRNHHGVGVIVLGRERRLCAVPFRDIRPGLLCTVTAAIANVQRKHLAGLLVQGAPDPLLVRLLFHEAPLCHRLPVPEDGVPTQGKN